VVASDWDNNLLLLDKNGNKVWKKYAGRRTNRIAFDSSNNVYIGGIVGSYYVTKYARDTGAVVWQDTTSFTAEINDIIVTSAGETYACSKDNGRIIRYNSSGAKVATINLAGAIALGYDRTNNIIYAFSSSNGYLYKVNSND